MRHERLWFLIGLVLMTVSILFWRAEGVAGAEHLTEARNAPNPTVERLALEQYKVALIRVSVWDLHVNLVDQAISMASIAESVPSSDPVRYAEAYAAALQAARRLSEPEDLVRDGWFASWLRQLSFAVSVVILLVTGITILAGWVEPKSQQLTVNCPHSDGESEGSKEFEVAGESA